MLKYLSKPAIIAHRGASAYAPENTLAAFELAIRQKADAVELDAKLTRDGNVVIFHNQTLGRTTGTHGRVIDATLSDLRRLDAGSFFDIAYRGEPIPTLEEVIAAVGNQIYIDIELRNYASPNDDLPDKVSQIVRNQGVVERVMFSSFNPLALVHAAKLLPEVPRGLLAIAGWRGALPRSWLGALLHYQVLIPSHVDTRLEMIENAHRRNRLFFVYTVNKPDEIRHFIQLGVDGIITDDPLTAHRILSNEFLHKRKDREQ